MSQQEEFEKDAKAVGVRLAMLLVAANLPDDVKADFASMIPQMTPEQLDRLAKILEANVADTAVAQEAELGAAVQAAQTTYQQERQSAQQKAMAELDEIEMVLKAG
jgi:ribosomal protein L16 Arg81 hydroxylase